MIVEYSKLVDMVKATFVKSGYSEEDAATMADILVTAEARGVYSHGIQQIPHYITNKNLPKNPEVKIIKESASTLLADGDGALGGIIMSRVQPLAMQKAKETGCCTLIVTNGGHYGAGAYYVEKAAHEGFVSYIYANTPLSAAPFGGKQRFLGTNPYSFAAPAGNGVNFVLDMATTETAASKLVAAINDKISVRPGLGIDKDGNPTTDPAAILYGGCLSHFGGPKGYGIAFMVSVVTGMLSGGAFMKNDIDLFGDKTGKCNVSYFMTLVDIAHFIDIDAFESRAGKFISDLKTIEPAPGFKEVFYPGEIENNNYAKALKEGVHIHDAAYDAFVKAAQSIGVEF